MWTDIMLATSQLALLAVTEIGTAGMATPLVVASLGVGAFQAGRKIDEAVDRSQAYDAAMSAELRLLTKEDVDAAVIDAVIESVGLFIDAYGAAGSFLRGASRADALAKLTAAESRIDDAVELAPLGRLSKETQATLLGDDELRAVLLDDPVIARLLTRCDSPCELPAYLTAAHVRTIKQVIRDWERAKVGYTKKELNDFLDHYHARGELDRALSEREMGAEPRLGPAVPATIEEALLSEVDYYRALGLAHPDEFLDPIKRWLDDLGDRAAVAAVDHAGFQAAVEAENWALAGTHFHKLAETEAKQVAGSLHPGWTVRAEYSPKTGKGGSRLDLLLEGPSGQLIEIDWKTTGKGAMRYGCRKEMEKHAQHIKDLYKRKVSEQLSKSWVDYVRQLLPSATTLPG